MTLNKICDRLPLPSAEGSSKACVTTAESRSQQMLRVRDLRREVSERVILTDITFSISRGEILFVRGPSGVGKSLLLRALAYLDPLQVITVVYKTARIQGTKQVWNLTLHVGLLQGGLLHLEDKSPEEIGIPAWRSRVTYVPQSRVHPRGTPSELYYTAQVIF